MRWPRRAPTLAGGGLSAIGSTETAGRGLAEMPREDPGRGLVEMPGEDPGRGLVEMPGEDPGHVWPIVPLMRWACSRCQVEVYRRPRGGRDGVISPPSLGWAQQMCRGCGAELVPVERLG